MAVYTHVPAEAIAALLADYGLGALRSAKGIAEGVENSNYLVDATSGRYILTLYEKRVDAADLPFFMALLDHLADRGLPVPRAVRDSRGEQVRELCGRPACLIEFLPGVSLSTPTERQCHNAARALGRLHKAAADFPHARANTMGIDHWRGLADRCADAHRISPRLYEVIVEELAFLEERWPRGLERSIVHADLFPDNVLMLGDEVGGLIDFYFAATDLRAYDLAVMHTAWCFSPDGTEYYPERARALREGYLWGHPFQPGGDVPWFAILCRGACLRFIMSRTIDWLTTSADAIVTPKDPMAYVYRLMFYQGVTGETALGY